MKRHDFGSGYFRRSQIMRLTSVVYICLIVAICIASEAHAITGATSVSVPHWVVGVQGPSACSGTLYTGNWILTAAHCIPNLDINGDGRIEGMEDPGSITICCGPDANGNTVDARPADLIVRHPESTFGSNTGSDTALVHVDEPFNIRWLIENQGAGPYYDSNGVLRLHTGSSSELDGRTLAVYGYATVWLGKAKARVSETFTGWYRTEPIDGGGGICGGRFRDGALPMGPLSGVQRLKNTITLCWQDDATCGRKEPTETPMEA